MRLSAGRKNAVIVVVLLALALVFAQTAVADTFTIREFVVSGTAGGTDLFNDGTPPPEGPRGASTYSTLANGQTSTFGPEQSVPGGVGGLQMTPSTQGVPSASPTGQPTLFQSALWLTPTVATAPGALINTVDFTVNAVFDLTQPTALGTSPIASAFYGIRLEDFTPTGGGNDVVELQLRRQANGDIVVNFFQLDFVAHTSTLLGQHILTATELSNTFLGLNLSHLASEPDVIHASYCFESAIAICAGTAFSTTGTVFSDEAFTRAAFIAGTPVPTVPEPATLSLLGGAGVALCAAMWRRRR